MKRVTGQWPAVLFLVLAAVCFCLKKLFWNPAYKFRAFGGPLEIFLGTLVVIFVLFAVWACLRRRST